MNRILATLLVLLAISLSACGGGGGGGSSVDDEQDSGSSGDSGNSGSGDSGTGGDNLNSGGNGAGGTVKPSTVSSGVTPGNSDSSDSDSDGSSSDANEKRFITYLNSQEDFGFWGCFTEESDNTLIMVLRNTETDGNIGLFAANPEVEEDFIQVTWSADSSNLVIKDSSGASGTFSNYQFTSDVRWDADFTSGDFADRVACGLFDQDGELVGDTDTQNDTPDTPPDSTDPAENFLTYFNSDTDFGLWGCFGQNVANRFVMTLYENDDGDRFGAFLINDNDPFPISWDADATALVVQDENGGRATFSNYAFTSDTRWDAEITLGDYTDDVACALYDQDGELVN